jgi:hypothetical protein
MRNPKPPYYVESDPCVVLAGQLAKFPFSRAMWAEIGLHYVDTPDKRFHRMTKAQMDRVIPLLQAQCPEASPELIARLHAFCV